MIMSISTNKSWGKGQCLRSNLVSLRTICHFSKFERISVVFRAFCMLDTGSKY